MEAIEGLRFLASYSLAGTGRTEGGEKTQPFNRFHSRLFISAVRQCNQSDLQRLSQRLETVDQVKVSNGSIDRLYGRFTLYKTVDRTTSDLFCTMK